MNRLVIIGNGFDLSLGLKTSYNHFLTNYIQKLVVELFEKSKFSREIVSDPKLGNTFQTEDDLILIKIPEYFLINPKKSEEYINEIKRIEVFREIIQYISKYGSIKFKSLLLKEIFQSSELKNWIDIEVLYFDTMISIYRRFESKPELEKKIGEYNSNFQFLKTKLVDYLLGIKIDLGNNNLDFYVGNFIEKLITPDDNGMTLSNIMFLSFNYTRSLEEIRKYYLGDKKLKINYIHGNISDPDSIIFGFGDESDKNYLELKDGRNAELLENIKRFHYPIEKKYDELGLFLDSGIYEVWIVGHSCGVSDRTILQEIVQNDNCKSIKIFHYDIQNPKKEYRQKSTQLMKFFSPSDKRPTLNFDPNDVMFQLQKRKN